MSDVTQKDVSARRATVPWTAAETVIGTAVALALSRAVASPLVWLFLGFALILLPGRSLSAYGLDLRFRPPSWGTHAVLGVLLLLGYAAIHVAIAHFALGRRLALRPFPDPFSALVQEFLAIGFPEEVFFRGYLQTRWDEALGKPWRIFATPVGPALVIQALLFGACHLIDGDWTRLRVVFFGLVAGWLRERSGSVLPSSVYHAVGNVWYRWLAASLL